jgi:hypothetical protein
MENSTDRWIEVHKKKLQEVQDEVAQLIVRYKDHPHYELLYKMLCQEAIDTPGTGTMLRFPRVNYLKVVSLLQATSLFFEKN